MPVDLERRDAVAVLTLNRPEALNALSPEMFDDLDRRLDEIAAAPELRAVVITGAGEKASRRATGRAAGTRSRTASPTSTRR